MSQAHSKMSKASRLAHKDQRIKRAEYKAWVADCKLKGIKLNTLAFWGFRKTPNRAQRRRMFQKPKRWKPHIDVWFGKYAHLPESQRSILDSTRMRNEVEAEIKRINDAVRTHVCPDLRNSGGSV